jgi:hypothetical protein
MLGGLVRRVTLHFDHGEDVGGGRRRTELQRLDVELQPEVSQLLGTGGSTRF